MFFWRPLLLGGLSWPPISLGNWWPVLGKEGKEPVGLLFDVDDPEDLMVKALKLIDDEKLRQNCIRTAKERASRWPTPEEEANGLIRVYEGENYVVPPSNPARLNNR